LEQERPEERDGELVRRTLAGDRPAFDILVGRYQRGLYALIRGIVRNSADADDLVQEAFFRAYRYLDRFDTDRNFRPWIFKIGANLSFQHLRKQRRGSWLSIDAEDPSTGRTLGDRLKSPGAEDAVPRRAEYRRLSEAMDQLPPLYRSILVLRAVHELHYEEIAETLCIPVGTVMSRLSRARRALRELIEPQPSPTVESRRSR
jgi:RNA polymerase sigma-70 factor (ECF subfamily)